MSSEDSGLSEVEAGRSRLEDWQSARPADYYESDPFFQGVVARYLGSERTDVDRRLHDIGASVAGPMELLAAECGEDHRLPRVDRVDSFGKAVEDIVFDPAYHELGALFWATGVLAEYGRPGREVVAGAIAYLLDHLGEAGHACPVACTAGAIKLLQRVGTDELRDRYLPGLLDSDYAEALRAAQFVTEVQGGSDVGANACRAEPVPSRPGWYRIVGEKWFCSVADADIFVVSARLPDGAKGTRGLGLFLVPRTVNGSVNGFTLNRLKTKLGTRAMATGEITFGGALGQAIGPLEDGFRNLVSIVLDTSRVHNAVSACGLMRRAYLEASNYAAHRPAFGVPIGTYPAVLEILSRMRLHAMAGVATTFRILDASDRLAVGRGDAALAAARRIDVMLNKYWTAIQATRVARDGIEVLGGNGTIEDFSVLPRLYRDAIVIESWEGTHNTLIAQVLRDFQTRGLHEAWLGVVRGEVSELGGGIAVSDLGRIADRVDRLEARIQAAVAGDGPERRHFRRVVDAMCRLVDLVALLSHATWEHGDGRSTGAAEAAQLYDLVYLEKVDPITEPRIGELQTVLGGAAFLK